MKFKNSSQRKAVMAKLKSTNKMLITKTKWGGESGYDILKDKKGKLYADTSNLFRKKYTPISQMKGKKTIQSTKKVMKEQAKYERMF